MAAIDDWALVCFYFAGFAGVLLVCVFLGDWLFERIRRRSAQRQ